MRCTNVEMAVGAREQEFNSGLRLMRMTTLSTCLARLRELGLDSSLVALMVAREMQDGHESKSS